MFRKIVTELAYSPALAGNLGSYMRQLRHEKSRRLIGLIFIILAVMVQLFATVFPPESANANNPAIFIDKGVHSTEEYLRHYDENDANLKDLLTSLGITRQEIETSEQKTISVTASAQYWSMQNTRRDDAAPHFFRTANSKLAVAYYQPATHITHAKSALIGKSASLNGWFAIENESGSLITENTPPCLAPISQAEKSASCPKNLELSLAARTISPTPAAEPEKVQASDRIAYTLTASNESSESSSFVPFINLEDTLEYSRILDTGGGEYNYDTKFLVWPETTVTAGETQKRAFTIQLLPVIPSTARGEYVAASYDCVVSSSFGSTVPLSVECPPTKYVERLSDALPTLSKEFNLFTISLLLIASTYFYFRSRVLLAELYIIRHVYLGGQ